MSEFIESALVMDQGDADGSAAIALPRLLEAQAAEELYRQLSGHLLSGLPVTVDGQCVDRIATPCIQVLVAAARTARSRQVPFRLQTPSAALTDALVQLGLLYEVGL